MASFVLILLSQNIGHDFFHATAESVEGIIRNIEKNRSQHEDAGWTLIPASALVNKQLMILDIPVIKKPGFLYIYLSYENDSPNLVYFDDFKITYKKSQVVQNSNYYPFGLQTKDSWTRTDTKPNQYLHNSGSELNSSTGWYETPLRAYDPAIGRFQGVDILADNYSSLTPYQFANNDPVFFSDPTGAYAIGDEWWNGPRSLWGGRNINEWKRSQRELELQAYAGPGGDGMYGSGYFGRYGTGDGGALRDFMKNMLAGAHSAAASRDAGVFQVNINMDELPDNTLTTILLTKSSIFALTVPFKGPAETLTACSCKGSCAHTGSVQESGAGLGDPNPSDILKYGPLLLLRMALHVPDAISINGNLNMVTGIGTDLVYGKSTSILKVLTGPDAGKTTSYWEIPKSVGWDMSVGVNLTEILLFSLWKSTFTIRGFSRIQSYH